METGNTYDRHPEEPFQLSVRTASGTHHLAVTTGQSVRDALDTTDFRVRAACGGTGTCGACTIRLISGEVSPPTVAEFMKLMPEERADGVRLACQMRIKGPTEILLDQPAPPSLWKSIAADDLEDIRDALPDLTEYPYGVAVDLGTTHIRVALLSLIHI